MPKDEKKSYGMVDESSLEQQFHNSDMLTFLCEKSEVILQVLVGLMAGWQAVRLNTGRPQNF